jgi:hypothetical protein
MLILDRAQVPIVCRVKFDGPKARTKSAHNSGATLALISKHWAKIGGHFLS